MRLVFGYGKKQQSRYDGRLCCLSAFTLESIAFCVAAAVSVVTGYIDGCRSTFAMFVIGTVVGFAVDVDSFTATAGVYSVCGGRFILAAETLTGSIICIACLGTFYIDGAFGTERILVVTAVMGGTF